MEIEAQEADASPGQTLTLDQLVRLALAHSPSLRAARAGVDAAAGRAWQAKPWSNPELEFRTEDWPLGNGRGFPDAKQTVGVAQTVPYPGKKSLDRRIGGAGVKVSAEELALRRTEVVKDVKAGFFRVLAWEGMVEAARELAEVARASAEAARKRVEAGAAPYQEQLRAEVQQEGAQAELKRFESELAAVRQNLAAVAGLPELSEARLQGALSESARASLLENDGIQALARHPSLLGARAALERAELEDRRARLAPYPDVRVAVAGGRIGETDQSVIELGIALPLPIFDRGKGRQAETGANVRMAGEQLRLARLELRRQWANAQNRYRAAAERATVCRERTLPKAAEALRLVHTGFEEGKFEFIDLADTQRLAAETRLAYQQTLLELNLAEVELEALLQPQTEEPPPTP